ncbi:MAG: hypothetical protein IJ681_01265 [Bacteroidales bacterium]|nr:hypothetical protein [Bacteroidales bacterium]
MNKLVLSLILLLSCFCACTKKDKTSAENQQIENEVVIRATRLHNKKQSTGARYTIYRYNIRAK